MTHYDRTVRVAAGRGCRKTRSGVIRLFTLLSLGLVLGQPLAAGVYSDLANGTVLDNVTNLVWQQEDDDQNSRSWEEALAYCETLELAGQTDWRLPNIRELYSLIDRSLTIPRIDQAYFPNTNLANYWTSTTLNGVPSQAHSVSFFSAQISPTNKTGLSNILVRCVRNS